MEFKRMNLDGGAGMRDNSASKRHPYTKYVTMHTNWRNSDGVEAMSRIIPKVLDVPHLRRLNGYAMVTDYDYMRDEEMRKYPELQPDSFEMFQAPRGTRFLERKELSDKEYFFQGYERDVRSFREVTSLCTAVDFTSEADFIRFAILPRIISLPFTVMGGFWQPLR